MLHVRSSACGPLLVDARWHLYRSVYMPPRSRRHARFCDTRRTGPTAGALLCFVPGQTEFSEPTQVFVTETMSSSKMMTIDSFGPEQSASARRGGKSRANNAAPSYAAQEPLLPQVRNRGTGASVLKVVSGAACSQCRQSRRSPGMRGLFGKVPGRSRQLNSS